MISIIDSNGINYNCTGAVRFEGEAIVRLPDASRLRTYTSIRFSMAEIMNALPFGSLTRNCPDVPLRQPIGTKREKNQ
jgi:hypothetical protein